MVATYASIASSFQRSSEGPWLLTMYTFGYIVALPVVCNHLNHCLLIFAYAEPATRPLTFELALF